MRIGFVGTGTMGTPIARCLVEAGHELTVYDRQRQATVMVGGERRVFDKYRELFEAIARNVFYVGPSGSGCAAKLVTQYLGYSNMIAALEGMLIGAKAGLDLEVLAQIVPVSAGASRTF